MSGWKSVLVFGRIVRVAWGFALACLAAAATLVAFVYAPGNWATLGAELSGERLSEAGFFALAITPHVIVSAALPAVLTAIYAETRKISGWPFYGLAGIGVGLVGFFLQHLTEAPDPESIFQAYALIAFLTAGLIGGLVYWAASGRSAAQAAAPAAAKAG
jgi:hypothetical protein